MDLLFLGYNNYYNRLVKRKNSITDYISDSAYNKAIKNVNFKPNDGVETTQIINWNESFTPDYLVCYEEDEHGTKTIKNRWFVMEFVRTREYQFRVSLRRDVIVDYLEQIRVAPIYVEKSIILYSNDVAIYNQENLLTNEIKQSETLLKDKSNVAWIVGYMDNKNVTNLNISIPNLDLSMLDSYPTVEDFYEAIHYDRVDKYQTPIWDMNNYLKISYDLSPAATPVTWDTATYDFNSSIQARIEHTGKPLKAVYFTEHSGQDFANSVALKLKQNENLILSDRKDLLPNGHNTGLEYYNNKRIVVGGTERIIRITKERKIKNGTAPNNSSISSIIRSAINTIDGYNYNSSGATYIEYNFYYNEYTLNLEETSALTLTWNNSSRSLFDAPYKMFCMPYGSIYCTNLSDGDETATLDDPNMILNIATTLAKELDTHIYDLQLLPYCPCSEILDDQNEFNFTGLTDGIDYLKIFDSDDIPREIIIFCKTSRGTFDIDYEIYCDDVPYNKKIQNQCDKYRLCSPNYSSQFDFNIAKTGTITKFNVDYTYKPYSPYIHINPNWSALYGQDFDDVRGLICQGDFSLPIVNDKWIDYQINNKNYLNAFNRQIENIEINQKYQRIGDVFGAIGGTATGAIGGAIAGGAAGAISGGIASAAAGIADIAINENLRKEALDFTKDNFNYSIQNIQAMPETLAKVSSFDYNNKIFPILEYYSCKEQEKDIMLKKMRYNGMTINRIDTMNTFLQYNDDDNPIYFKGKLIRLLNIYEDKHVISEIANELDKGVYLIYEDTI